jgi:FMN phosphatase YigB (HAD superfamily)
MADVSPFRSGAGKPVIALDIDGTLGDYHKHFLWFATHWFGREFPPPEEARYGVRLSTFMGISHREYRECKLAYRQGGLKRFMPAYPFASELTSGLREDGAHIWLCTTRPYLRLDNIDPDTREWLRRNKIEYDAVIFPGLDEDEGSKYRDLIEQVGLERIVAICDDLPEQTDDAYNRGIETVYIRDQPYNRANSIHRYRIHDLTELHRLLSIDLYTWKEQNA